MLSIGVHLPFRRVNASQKTASVQVIYPAENYSVVLQHAHTHTQTHTHERTGTNVFHLAQP
jgi:hypothetical protein